MKFKKEHYAVMAIAAFLAAGVVWASNNVDAVEDVIG